MAGAQWKEQSFHLFCCFDNNLDLQQAASEHIRATGLSRKHFVGPLLPRPQGPIWVHWTGWISVHPARLEFCDNVLSHCHDCKGCNQNKGMPHVQALWWQRVVVLQMLWLRNQEQREVSLQVSRQTVKKKKPLPICRRSHKCSLSDWSIEFTWAHRRESYVTFLGSRAALMWLVDPRY